MGRKKKELEDKKIKIGISLDRKLYNLLSNDNHKISRIIEKIIKEYYEYKNL